MSQRHYLSAVNALRNDEAVMMCCNGEDEEWLVNKSRAVLHNLEQVATETSVIGTHVSPSSIHHESA